jgi:hypothetical protein
MENNLTIKEIRVYGTVVPQTGQSVFRSIIGKVKDLKLNLILIENDRVIKKKAEDIAEAIKAKEPKSFEAKRKAIQAEKDETVKNQLINDFENEYNEFFSRDDIQAFLKEDSGVVLTRIDKPVGFWEKEAFDTDQVELLMLFSNIADQPEKETGKPLKKK